MKSLTHVLTFFAGAPLLILGSTILLYNLSPRPLINPLLHVTHSNQVLSAQISLDSAFFLPLPVGHFATLDARTIIIKNYLHKYSSPLEPFSGQLVEISDKYSLDYRLLAAIAQQESNLCKKIPDASHNCWGFGIYGDKVTRFENYPQAMEIVAKTLKNQYIDRGLRTPEEIMAKYTPPSLEKGGPWAKGVSQFMADLE